MANIKSALKRANQAEEARKRNSSHRSKMRTLVKATVAAIKSADKTAAQEAYKRVVPVLDKSVTKGVITLNKSARHKSRLNAQIKAL